MEIVRNTDGSLVVPIPEGRHHDGDDEGVYASDSVAVPTTRVLHPGEGGYSEYSPNGTYSRIPTANRPSPRRVGEKKP